MAKFVVGAPRALQEATIVKSEPRPRGSCQERLCLGSGVASRGVHRNLLVLNSHVEEVLHGSCHDRGQCHFHPYRRELTCHVATNLAKVGRIGDALQAIDEQTLDGFIGSVAIVHSAWKTAPPGAIESSLRELIHVAAWIRSDWRHLRDTLFGN
jgi:hypothetical protein